MGTGTIVLIVVVALVVIGIVALIVRQGGSRREEAERAKAEELREQATEHDRELREQEAEASEVRAEAELAQAEAEKQRLEAERLEHEASQRAAAAGGVRDEREQQLREADLHDPDVRTDDEGRRLDADEHHEAHGDGRDDVRRTDDAPSEEPRRDPTV